MQLTVGMFVVVILTMFVILAFALIYELKSRLERVERFLSGSDLLSRQGKGWQTYEGEQKP